MLYHPSLVNFLTTNDVQKMEAIAEMCNNFDHNHGENEFFAMETLKSVFPVSKLELQGALVTNFSEVAEAEDFNSKIKANDCGTVCCALGWAYHKGITHGTFWGLRFLSRNPLYLTGDFRKSLIFHIIAVALYHQDWAHIAPSPVQVHDRTMVILEKGIPVQWAGTRALLTDMATGTEDPTPEQLEWLHGHLQEDYDALDIDYFIKTGSIRVYKAS